MYKRLKTILRRNGLPDIRFHDLRHTAASVMLTLNIPDKHMKHHTFSGASPACSNSV